MYVFNISKDMIVIMIELIGIYFLNNYRLIAISLYMIWL